MPFDHAFSPREKVPVGADEGRGTVDEPRLAFRGPTVPHARTVNLAGLSQNRRPIRPCGQSGLLLRKRAGSYL